MDLWNKAQTLAYIAANITIDDNGCHNWGGSTSSDGYGQISITGIYDRWKIRGVHRLAYHLATDHEYASKEQVLHSCDNRACCNVDHLRVGTAIENANDARIRDRLLVGERHKMAKLTNAEVRDIKRCILSGLSNPAISAMFDNASSATVSAIRTGRSWRNVTV
jgi:hypothetical protein